MTQRMRLGSSGRPTHPNEILAFIDAARRLPDGEKKQLWVKFLVRQFELSCSATVIKADLCELHKYEHGKENL